jgi:Bacterial PH domain
MSSIAETGSSPVTADKPPTICQLSLAWRIGVAGVFVLLLCGCLGGIVALLASAADRPSGGTLAGCLILAAIAVIIAWQLAIFLTWRVTLTPDAIERSSWFSRRRIRRDEIKGLRVHHGGRAGNILVVVPVSPGPKKISLPLRFMQQDPAFSAWFAGLRNLDAEDLQQSVAAIAANPAYGATPEERLRRLARARKIAYALNLVAGAALLWSFFMPQPYPLVIASLTALPILAVVLVASSRGLFRIGIRATEAHASLGAVCMLPALAVMLRMLFDLNMVNSLPLIGAAAGAAVLFTPAIVVADRALHRKPWMLLGVALCTAAYAYGVLGEANALLDRSPRSVFQSQILGKHISTGKHTSYYFRLAPWGPRTEPGDVSVPQAVYDRLQPGNPACVLLRDGALGMPWFLVLTCR